MEIVKKESKTLKAKTVELREATVDDLLQAERIAGRADGLEFMLAVLSQVALFDGQAQPAEELRRLSSKDFLAISKELEFADAETLPTGSSISSAKESSAKSA